MKNLLCKFGFHKPQKCGYMVVTKTHKNGKKYHRNYRYCKRCGKRMGLVSFNDIEGGKG